VTIPSQPSTGGSLEATGPNAEQIEYWNATSGPKWVALADRIDAQIAALGEEAMGRAGVAPGERVLDVGCGCGHTSVALGERVGTGGSVLGVDVSSVMLASAHRRAEAARLRHVAFLNADAQTHPFEEGSFDLVYSRFGVMFFADPGAAFANLARALRPGGRLVFVCWQSLARNPWMRVPVEAASAHVEIPAPADPHAPGPFAFADAGRVRGFLETAGFGPVEVEPLERELAVGGGGDLDATVGFLLQMGPAGAALREADEALRARVAASVRRTLAPYTGLTGVRMPAAAWLFAARRPGA